MTSPDGVSGTTLVAQPQSIRSTAQAPPPTTSPSTSRNTAAITAIYSDGQHQPCFHSIDCTSPRQLPSDLSDAILEEGAESGSEYPPEPVTPTSADGARHSRDFKVHNSADENNNYFPQYDHSRSTSRPSATPPKTPLALQSPTRPQSTKDASARPTAEPVEESHGQPAAVEREDPAAKPRPRQFNRSHSNLSFKRTMTNIFRRGGSGSGSGASSQVPTPGQQTNGTASPTSQPPAINGMSIPRRSTAPLENLVNGKSAPSSNGVPPPSKGSRRFSISRSATTTRSNTPPSPGSPLQPSMSNIPTSTPADQLPEANDFDAKKKNRSSTGLSLRGRTINFLAPASRSGRSRERRASSFDSERASSKSRPPKSSHGEGRTFAAERQPWEMIPDAGTGAKARRMSLSLPDDFTVDVAELLSEFEYQRKFLGRHGKHLGKGAASKVTLMARKGCPDELYAVKEFRSKNKSESKEDYEKKIKSEYSIAKSLHHPNIVETIRLCTDHSRWNHVMEYCSEGDLFSLVAKGYLKEENKKKDRMCLFKQLVQGIDYLHRNGIAHRDIKLENLLITKDSKLKITDFGVSEVFCGTHPGLREAGGQCGKNMGEVRLCSPGICGSEPYIAPEVLAKKHAYDPRPLDVWSAAIVMVYLTFGGAIWARAAPGNPHYDTLVRGWERWNAKHPEPDACITELDYPHHNVFDKVVSPPALRRVLLQMLNPDPARRIGIAEVANNRWLKGVECCQPESYDDPTRIVDASKRDGTWNGHKKIFCHNHLPPKSQGHSLGKMPGQPGY
ncbi:Serine/threonine-protein kinase-like protein [Hapsidospora chrysogenum ATCC 11550]|uniref:Serine/threonine-protein kinase-like protein n=1 Tax=Hapsidospora chrysogenum (strain ATCC 11550 / CBS 779.69 / DSM 880 / IAM 14645 / JCM 23072 / IMI 49137) TaxID=857340 RepID=A0A086TC93_HAPC1|nr:Serine/threonine-protein kinase-like protein [Hapsidospora chrysogenum ATCC 11550]